MGKLIGWGFVALLALVPFNWIRLRFAGELPQATTIGELLLSCLISWALAAGLGYLMIVLRRRDKARKAQEQREIEALATQPLPEVRPRNAILKPGERAYAAVPADLNEEKTVGYKGGSSGVSVHVAKGVTVRTSGSRGQAVKGMVSVAKGELVVTDRRVIFAGDNKSFALDLTELLSITNYADGFGLSGERATYKVGVQPMHTRVRIAVILRRVLAAAQEAAQAGGSSAAA